MSFLDLKIPAVTTKILQWEEEAKMSYPEELSISKSFASSSPSSAFSTFNHKKVWEGELKKVAPVATET